MQDIHPAIDPVWLDPRHKWVIDGKTMQYLAPGHDGYLFVLKGSKVAFDPTSVYEPIKTDKLVEILADKGRWSITLDYYTDRNIALRNKGTRTDVTEVTPKVRDRALLKYRLYKDADEFRRKHHEPDSVQAKCEALQEAWNIHVAETEQWNRENPAATRSLILKGCPVSGTFDNWAGRIEVLGDSPSSLIDGRHANSGNHSSKLTIEQERIITSLIHDYFDERAPSIAAQYVKCKTLVGERNKEIRLHNATPDLGPKEALPLVRTPGERAFYRRFNVLSPYIVKVMRHGYEKADAEFHSTGTGNLQFRPGMWSEGDTYVCDLQVVLEGTTAWKTLTPAQRKKAKAVRLRVMVIIDAATDAITAIGVSWSENAEIAAETVRMSVGDKTEFAKALGCKTPWPMYSAHNLVVDNMSAFGDPAVRAAALEAIGGFQRSVVGRPWLRAKIERFFRTIAEMLLGFFTGRTFSNVVELDGRNPQERASMFAMQLRESLIRWVVDGYHNQPVKRLGMTPYQAWLRLSEGAPPPAQLTDERVSYIFADVHHKVLSGSGVLAANEHYNSEALNALFKLCGRRRLPVKIDYQNLGHVFVKVPAKFQSRVVNSIDLDDERGRWLVVPGPEAWRGASLWQLQEASRKLDTLFAREAKLGEEAWLEVQLALAEAGKAAIVRRGLNIRPSQNEIARAMKGFHPGLHHLKREAIAARHDMESLHAAFKTGGDPETEADLPGANPHTDNEFDGLDIPEDDDDDLWDDEAHLAREADNLKE